MKSQITIKDLARELSISPSTVSRALKDHPDISPETKKVVKDLAEEMNYQPNLLAQGLRKSKTNTIGVIVPEFIHFFFSTVLAGIEDVAYSRGYHVMMTRSAEEYEREVANVKALWNSRVDGLLVSLSKSTISFDHFQEVMDNGLPVVFFDRTTKQLDCSRVVVDDHDGSFKAVELLIAKGCKKIVHLAGPKALGISDERIRGYLDCLAQNGIEKDDDLIVRCAEGGYEESKARTTELMNSIDGIDGIFANHDMAALGAILALQEKGVQVPEQVKVVGFSDWQLSHLIKPQLTTVSQPGFEMGQEAAQLLIEEIESEVTLGVRKELKTTLIEREST
jgi:LacI family transcriptional regulator